jgi:hypothetical protein
MAKQMETAEQIERRVKEDTKKLFEMKRTAAKENFSSAINLITSHAKHWTDAQRERIARLIQSGDSPSAKKPSNKAGKKAVKKKSNSLKGRVVPDKYQIPGEKPWKGRGRMPLVYIAYAKKHGITEDTRKSGKKDFPLLSAATTPKAPAKKAQKTPAKKAGKKSARKAVKKKAAASASR